MKHLLSLEAVRRMRRVRQHLVEIESDDGFGTLPEVVKCRGVLYVKRGHGFESYPGILGTMKSTARSDPLQ